MQHACSISCCCLWTRFCNCWDATRASYAEIRHTLDVSAKAARQRLQLFLKNPNAILYKEPASVCANIHCSGNSFLHVQNWWCVEKSPQDKLNFVYTQRAGSISSSVRKCKHWECTALILWTHRRSWLCWIWPQLDTWYHSAAQTHHVKTQRSIGQGSVCSTAYT